MKVAQINGGAFGSTGKIMFGIVDVSNKNGIETLCFSPITSTNRFQEPNHKYIKIGSYRSRQISVLLARITGLSGCFSIFSTRKLLKDLTRFNPDIIHLHNLHESFINLPMLFSHIKKHNIPVVWTLHDCWPFTGHCSYYSILKCEKWKSGCENCPQYKAYPKSFFDNSKIMYRLKRKWFNNIENITFVAVSEWLANEARHSFLKGHTIKVINNGIDLSVFKPIKSDFKERYEIFDKKMVLGVAMPWSQRKGLNDFIELSKVLDDKEYKIVLVGTDEKTDVLLPENIISVHRTQNQAELAEIYSAADVFVNPSLEETMGLVTVEAIACGTPAVTYNQTAVPEKITSQNGIVVSAGDIDALVREIPNALKLDRTQIFKTVSNLDYIDKYQEYVDLYAQILGVGEINEL